MSRRFTRRASLAALTVVALIPIGGCPSNDDDSTEAPSETSAPSSAPADISADEEFDELERAYDVRLGVYAVDTRTEQEIEYRADERFGHASTFKALLCGVVLQQHSIDDLAQVITYTRDDLVFHSPITEPNVDTGMSIAQLCEAAVRYSDNTATNLLLDEIGGPGGLQEALRENGDAVISTDRYEIETSEAVPGDTRDTSTPRSIGTSKTGNGGYGTRNAIAVAWPPGGDPLVIAVLSSRDQEGAEHDDQLIADAAEVVVDALAEAPTD